MDVFSCPTAWGTTILSAGSMQIPLKEEKNVPELPEVETLRRDLLKAGIRGLQIRGVSLFWERTVAEPDPDEFRKQICRYFIEDVLRRGKYLQFVLSYSDPSRSDLSKEKPSEEISHANQKRSLLVHLRMTGGLSLVTPPYTADIHDRVIFDLGSRLLVYHDTRKFGRMRLTSAPEKILDTLGPEPLDPLLQADCLQQAFNKSRRSFKALLLDQSVLAGLGNIYADESLFAAGLSPFRTGDSLTDAEAEKLLDGVRQTLSAGILNRGTSLGDGDSNFSSSGVYGSNAGSLMVFRRTGEACYICGTAVERTVLAQRSTHYCPVCQKALEEV